MAPARFISTDRLTLIQDEPDWDMETAGMNCEDGEASDGALVPGDLMRRRSGYFGEVDETGEGGSKGFRLPKRRTISMVLVVTALAGCAMIGFMNTQKHKLKAQRIGSHPAFVSYVALPVDRTLAAYPQLCDAAVVAEVCTKLNEGKATSWMAVSKLKANLAASQAALDKYLGRAGVWNWFGYVSCSELCEKTVALFPPQTLPATSSTGCITVGGAPICNQPLGNGTRATIVTEPTEPERSRSFENRIMPFPTPPPGNHVNYTQTQIKTGANHPNRAARILENEVARLYHIAPLLTVNSNAGLPGSRKMIMVAPDRQLDAAAISAKIQSDLNVITGLLASAIRRIEESNATIDAKFVTWFGQDNQKTKDTVKGILAGVHAVLIHNEKGVFWDIKDECTANPKAYAYTYQPEMKNAEGQTIIVVCPLYISSTQLCQLETIFHELTHLALMNTDDYVYGYAGNQKQGKSCKDGEVKFCNEALDNADTYTYFLYDIMDYYTGTNSVENRIKAKYDKYKAEAKAYAAKMKAKAKAAMAASSR